VKHNSGLNQKSSGWASSKSVAVGTSSVAAAELSPRWGFANLG